MVTARKMHELGLADGPLPETQPVETAPRPLTAAELIVVLDSDVVDSDVVDSDVVDSDVREANALEANVLESEVLEADVARPELDLGQVRELAAIRDGAAHPRSA
jgi:hypothetical protein